MLERAIDRFSQTTSEEPNVKAILSTHTKSHSLVGSSNRCQPPTNLYGDARKNFPLVVRLQDGLLS